METKLSKIRRLRETLFRLSMEIENNHFNPLREGETEKSKKRVNKKLLLQMKKIEAEIQSLESS